MDFKQSDEREGGGLSLHPVQSSVLVAASNCSAVVFVVSGVEAHSKVLDFVVVGYLQLSWKVDEIMLLAVAVALALAEVES